jgi:hypothetical protein
MTFKTQKQIWEHLIANEGKPCVKSLYGRIIGLVDGETYDFTDGKQTGQVGFYEPFNWQPYTEPEKCWLEVEAKKKNYSLACPDCFKFGAKDLAHEAIKRIEQWYEKELGKVELNDIASVKILKELIGDRDEK